MRSASRSSTPRLRPVVKRAVAPDPLTLKRFFEDVYRPQRLSRARPALIRFYRDCISGFTRSLGRPATLSDVFDHSFTEFMSDVVCRAADHVDAKSAVEIGGAMCKAMESIWRYAVRKKLVSAGPERAVPGRFGVC